MYTYINYFETKIKQSKVYLLLLAMFLSAMYLSTGFYRVGLEQQAIILRLGRLHEIVEPGLHFKLPAPIDELILVDVGQARCMLKLPSIHSGSANVLQQYASAIANNSNGSQSFYKRTSQSDTSSDNKSIYALTGDESIAELSFNVIWTVKDCVKFVFTARYPEETLTIAAHSILREVIARHQLDRILTIDRDQITHEIHQELQSFMDACDLGIHINEVQLGRIDPPAHTVFMEDDKKSYCVIDIYREVQRAKADFERSKNDAESYANYIIPEARGKAESMLNQASSYRARKLAQANGEAAVFEQLRAVYERNPAVAKSKLRAELRKHLLTKTHTIIGNRSSQPLVNLTNKV